MITMRQDVDKCTTDELKAEDDREGEITTDSNLMFLEVNEEAVLCN